MSFQYMQPSSASSLVFTNLSPERAQQSPATASSQPIFEFFGFRKSQLKIDHCGLNCALFLFFFDLFLFVFPFALFAFPHFPLNSLRKASEKDLSNPATLKSSAILS